MKTKKKIHLIPFEYFCVFLTLKWRVNLSQKIFFIQLKAWQRSSKFRNVACRLSKFVFYVQSHYHLSISFWWKINSKNSTKKCQFRKLRTTIDSISIPRVSQQFCLSRIKNFCILWRQMAVQTINFCQDLENFFCLVNNFSIKVIGFFDDLEEWDLLWDYLDFFF
jgi:hypothetical protein